MFSGRKCQSDRKTRKWGLGGIPFDATGARLRSFWHYHAVTEEVVLWENAPPQDSFSVFDFNMWHAPEGNTTFTGPYAVMLARGILSMVNDLRDALEYDTAYKYVHRHLII